MHHPIARVAFGSLLCLGLLAGCQEDAAPPAPAASAKATTSAAKPAASASAAAKTGAGKPWTGARKDPDGVKASVKGEEVTYEADGVKLKGYIAWDEAIKGERPGVLVVHEWWGHNEYARKRARMLASLGYTALAVDMYGDGKQAKHPDDAKKFMMEVFDNMPDGEKRFVAAEKFLDEHVTTKPEKTAAVGYCFGGAVVLHMARKGADLAAVASFHGNLSTKAPAKKGDIKGTILVANGEADPMVDEAQIEGFKKEMEAAEVKMRFVSYPDAKHAFTNPDATQLGKEFELPLAYDKSADEQSWEELRMFLNSAFAAKN